MTWLNPTSEPSKQPWFRCDRCDRLFYGLAAGIAHALTIRHRVRQIS